MSGNFDFPPATAGTEHSSSQTNRPTTIDPRVTRQGVLDSQAAIYRQQLVNEERRRIYEDEYRHYTTSHGSTRRQHHEDEAAANQNFPTSAVRPRVLGSRLRRRVYPQERVTGSLSNPHRGPVQFSPASYGIDLPEPSLPRIGSRDMATAEYSGEAEVNRLRKRRKLDDDRSSAGMKGFSYGWKGQVVPGQLRMEIHDCDGGLHAEAAQQGQQYWPQNLLRNDKSVYCTEKSQCNIILRHIGETCFTLKKLVIKAPERGFTAPIQEGMIFVSMDAEDLRSRTSQYRLRSYSLHNLESGSDSVPSTSPLASRPVSRRRDGTTRTVPPPISNSNHRSTNHAADPRPDWNFNDFLRQAWDASWDGSLLPEDSARQHGIANSAPTRLNIHPATSQGFDVTTHCNDPSSDEEEESSPQTLADRYQREHMPPSFSPTSEDEAEDVLERALRARRLGIPPNHLPSRRRGRRRDEPSHIEIVTSAAQQDGKEEPLTPHARFFIEKEKSVVSVSFEPPVYILLKLWSPSENQNIDVQSIVAHGFAGPRMFPAGQML
ncbi:MAG: hypothetical protein Q9217_002690 [Psora testacea]